MDLNSLALSLFALINSFTGNAGLTIILIAIASRLLLFPLTLSTLRYSKKMQELKPQLDELKIKHKDDRRKHMEEQSRVMKEANVNPFAGCLPAILQIVVLIFLYQILTQFLNQGHNPTFFWLNLSKPDVIASAPLPFGLKIPGVLVIGTALVYFLNAKMTMPPASQTSKPAADDFASSMQTQSLYLFPLLTLLFGTFYPSGLALYLLVSTMVDIIQRYYTVGPGGLANWLPVKRVS